MVASAVARRVLHPLQEHVVNPIVGLAWRLGIPIPGDALLETTGRHTGLRRRTPVCNGLDGQVFWLVAQTGRDADWVRNIEAEPRVRVKVSGPNAAWRTGTAHIVADDDPRERLRAVGRADLSRKLCVATSGAVATNPISVRVDLDPVGD
jgi:deazaflavin-dependent oxidoreductase (nitroreductase family)